MTGLFIGHVPGWSGAHSQGATLDELQANLREVVEMLLEDGEWQVDLPGWRFLQVSREGSRGA